MKTKLIAIGLASTLIIGNCIGVFADSEDVSNEENTTVTIECKTIDDLNYHLDELKTIASRDISGNDEISETANNRIASIEREIRNLENAKEEYNNKVVIYKELTEVIDPNEVDKTTKEEVTDESKNETDENSEEINENENVENSESDEVNENSDETELKENNVISYTLKSFEFNEPDCTINIECKLPEGGYVEVTSVETQEIEGMKALFTYDINYYDADGNKIDTEANVTFINIQGVNDVATVINNDTGSYITSESNTVSFEGADLNDYSNIGEIEVVELSTIDNNNNDNDDNNFKLANNENIDENIVEEKEILPKQYSFKTEVCTLVEAAELGIYTYDGENYLPDERLDEVQIAEDRALIEYDDHKFDDDISNISDLISDLYNDFNKIIKELADTKIEEKEDEELDKEDVDNTDKITDDVDDKTKDENVENNKDENADNTDKEVVETPTQTPTPVIDNPDTTPTPVNDINEEDDNKDQEKSETPSESSNESESSNDSSSETSEE